MPYPLVTTLWACVSRKESASSSLKTSKHTARCERTNAEWRTGKLALQLIYSLKRGGVLSFEMGWNLCLKSKVKVGLKMGGSPVRVWFDGLRLLSVLNTLKSKGVHRGGNHAHHFDWVDDYDVHSRHYWELLVTQGLFISWAWNKVLTGVKWKARKSRRGKSLINLFQGVCQGQTHEVKDHTFFLNILEP